MNYYTAYAAHMIRTYFSIPNPNHGVDSINRLAVQNVMEDISPKEQTLLKEIYLSEEAKNGNFREAVRKASGAKGYNQTWNFVKKIEKAVAKERFLIE